MQIHSKRAIETHIIILLLFSIFMTMILVVVLDKLYGNQHLDCDKLKLEITEKSRDKALVRFAIESNLDANFVLKEYPELSTFSIKSKEIKRNTVRKKGNTISILPIIIVDDNIFECREKIIKISVKTLI